MQTLPLWRTHRKVNNVQLFFVEIMPWELVTLRAYFFGKLDKKSYI
jgi:hypothetical protein